MAAHLGQGYDCTFEKPPPKEIETECPICLLVLRDPSQVHCCGKVLCTVCLRKALREGSGRCPLCAADNPGFFADQNLRRILSGYRVYCTNRERGCEWVDELGELSNHLNTYPTPDTLTRGCLFVEVACQLCQEVMARSRLPDHTRSLCPWRSYTCPHCDLKGFYNDIVNNHLEVCQHVPSPCPYCEDVFDRCDLSLHIRNQCIFAPIPCPFGCHDDLLRLEMGTHIKENAMAHARLLLDTAEEGGADSERVALFRMSLQAVFDKHSELLEKMVALTDQVKVGRERAVRLETIQLILVLAVSALFLVAIVMAVRLEAGLLVVVLIVSLLLLIVIVMEIRK